MESCRTFSSVHIHQSIMSDIWVIDQARGQDGWILVKFFFACLLTEMRFKSINMQKKKDQGQHPAILTKQAWSIKDSLYTLTPKQDKFSLRAKARIPSGPDSSILSTQVANHSTRFGSSCPLTELVI